MKTTKLIIFLRTTNQVITDIVFTVNKTIQIIIIKLQKQNTVYYATKMNIYLKIVFITLLIKIELTKIKIFEPKNNNFKRNKFHINKINEHPIIRRILLILMKMTILVLQEIYRY